MAIGAPWVGTVVEGSVAGTNGTSVTVDVSGATDGEVVWIIGTLGDAELGTVLPPTGWNLYTENSEGTSGGSSSRTIAFWKVKASGDGSTTISDAGNWTVSTKRQFVPISWPGVDTTTPAEGLSNVAHTSGASYATGTDTPTSNDRWAVGVFSSRGSTASVAWAADAALTSRASVINSSSVFVGLLVADSNGAVTQASHSYTSTGQTASHGLGLLLFLIPAAGGGGGGGATDVNPTWFPGFMIGVTFPVFMANTPSPVRAVSMPYDLGTAAGNIFTQSLSGDVGFTSGENLQTGKLTSATTSFTSSQLRAIQTKLATATVAFTGAVTRQLARSLVAVLSFAGSLGTAAVHHFTQALNATLSFTSSQVLRTGHLVGATLSFTSSQARVARAHLNAAVSFTSSQARAVRTGLPVATLSFAGAITRRIATVRSATVSFAGSVSSAAVHHFTQALNATVGFTGSLSTAAVHFFTQLLSATLSFTSSQSRRTAHGMAGAVGFTGADTVRTSRALAGSVGFTTADAFRTSTHLAGSVSFAGVTHVRVGKLLAGGVSFTGSVATQAVHFFTQALSATLSFTGALTTRRVIAKALSATVGFTSAQTRRAGHVVAASVAFAGTQVRSVKSHLAAVLGLSGGLGLVPTLLSALTNLRIRISGRRGTGTARGREGPTAISGREGDTLASGEEEGTQ
jgi:hypothetical protein